MANDIGIRIGLEGLAAYNRDLAKAQSATQKTGDGMSTAFSTANRSINQLISSVPGLGVALEAAFNPIVLGAAAVTGLGAAVSGFIQDAAELEQTRITFETLTGSAERAESVLSQLREFGANTPFEFPGIADAARNLIAFGTEAERVPEILTQLGNVSAGIGAPLNEIAEIYGKINVQGRVFAEDINQLTGRGIPVIGELAKQFGVAESEVRNLVSSGAVGFPQIAEAFRALSAEGGQFSGLLAAQSQTLNGQLSTLRDNFAALSADIGTVFLPAANAVVGVALDAVQGLRSLDEVISDNAEVLILGAGAFIGYNQALIGVQITNAVQAFSNLNAFIARQPVIIAASEFALGTYRIAVGLLTGQLTLAEVAQKALNFAMRANPVGLIITGVAALGAAFVAAYRSSQQFRQIIAGLGNAAKTVFTNIGRLITDAILGPIRAINFALEGDFQSALQAVIDGIPLANIGKLGEGVADSFVDGYQGRLRQEGIEDASKEAAERLAKIEEEKARLRVAGVDAATIEAQARLNVLNDSIEDADSFKRKGSAIGNNIVSGAQAAIDAQPLEINRIEIGPNARTEYIAGLLELTREAQQAVQAQQPALSPSLAGLQVDPSGLVALQGGELSAVSEQIRALGLDVDFVNQSFATTAELTSVLDGGIFNFGQRLGASQQSALELAVGFDALGQSLKRNLVDGAGQAFQAFGNSIGQAIKAGNGFADSFKGLVTSLAELVLVQAPKYIGLFLLDGALKFGFPAGIPLAIAGLGLLGLSGIAGGLLGGGGATNRGLSAPAPSVSTATAGAIQSPNAAGLSSVAAAAGASQSISIFIDGQEITNKVLYDIQLSQELSGAPKLRF